jgi:hypothetical protein
MIFDGDPLFATGTLRRMLGTTKTDDSDDDEPRPPSPIDIVSATVHKADDPLEVFQVQAGSAIHIRVVVEIHPAGVGRSHSVRLVFMGLGLLPIMILHHRHPPEGIPAAGGVWEITFTIESLPEVAGAMLLAVQVDDENNQPLATYTTTKGLFIGREGELGGLVGVDYVSQAVTQI